MSFSIVQEEQIAKTFNSRFDIYGAVPEASLWFSEKRQLARYEIILKILETFNNNEIVMISDIGCGYGGFFQYLDKNFKRSKFKYFGYDIAEKLIDYCLDTYDSADTDFFNGSRLIQDTDFSIISGTYNYAPNNDVECWRTYMRNELQQIFQKTRKYIIFNLMISKNVKISKAKIFYEELEDIISFCQKDMGHTRIFDHPLLPNEKTFLVKRKNNLF